VKMDMLRFIGASTVDFPILGADPSGPFVLKGADGLGPPPVTVRMGKTVFEQAMYQGKSAALRQVVVVVGLQPNWDEGQTAEDLRETLYGLLTPRYGQLVKCQIMNDGNVQAFCQGQVSKLEPAIFTKDPAVQITLDCDYGYLLALNNVIQQPVQRTVGGIRAFDVENEGTAPAGFKMGVTLMANVGNTLVLKDDNPSGMKFQVDGINWVAGDRFVIDTRPGSRGVWRGPGGGALQSVLNNMNAAVSEWLYLYGGDNTLTLNTTAFDWDLLVDFRHQPAYWGV
jgi:hypothetical protein